MRFPEITQDKICSIASYLPNEPRLPWCGRISDRVVWGFIADSESGQKIVEHAESFLDTPIPPLSDELYLQYTQTGNRSNYEKVYFHRVRDRFSSLVIAELLENRGRFLPAIEAEFAAMFAEKSWVLPAHDAQLTNFHGTLYYADLFCSEVCADLALYDWWLQDRLAPETRRRLREEVEKRMFHAYRQVIRTGEIIPGQWWTVCGNNWNSVCHSQLILAAMILLPNKRERAEFVAGAEAALKFFAQGFPEDGYCTEGMDYWNYGYGRFILLAEVVELVTEGRLSFYDSIPLREDSVRLRNAASYAKDIQIEEGICPAFADCSPSAHANEALLRILQYRYPESVLRNYEPTADAPFGTIPMFLWLIEHRSGVRAVPGPNELAIRSYFNCAGVYLGRSVKDGHHFGLAIKAGNNAEQHNHNDIGSFVIVRDKHAYFLDPGGEPYTQRTFSAHRYDGKLLNSYGHNVPVLGEVLQSPGKGAYGTFLENTFTDDQDTLVMDMKTAYPEAKGLKKLLRTCIFDRQAQTVTIKDEVEFEEAQTFEMALLTDDVFEYPKPGTVAAVWNGNKLFADITVEGAGFSFNECLIPNDPKPSPRRVGITLDKPVQKATMTIFFHA